MSVYSFIDLIFQHFQKPILGICNIKAQIISNFSFSNLGRIWYISTVI